MAALSNKSEYFLQNFAAKAGGRLSLMQEETGPAAGFPALFRTAGGSLYRL